MCVSRFYKVIRLDDVGWVEVEGADRRRSRASLLAYDGDELFPGEWVSVLSGYVIDRVDDTEAARTIEEIRRAEASIGAEVSK